MALKRIQTSIMSSLPEPINKFNDREFRWLYYCLCKEHDIDQKLPNYNSIDHSRRIQSIAKFIEEDKYSNKLMREILTHHNDAIVPKEHIEWIDKKNQRLLIWCMKHLEVPGRFIPSDLLQHMTSDSIRNTRNHSNIPDIQSYDNLIFQIDIWGAALQRKIDFLLEKKEKWILQKTSDKDIKWISPKEHLQLIWAWDYLVKHKQNIGLYNLLSDNDYYSAVLASFDEMSLSLHPAEKTLFLEKMKKTWTQKKYRDSGKAKKPYYLPLTIKTREKLDWLSENSGQKQTVILEQLINESYTKAQKS